MASKLRATIENKIGRSILEKYCVIKEGSSGPIMIPPIPNSKYIDKLPENVVLKGANLTEKEHQRGYEAEVKVYRSFEEVKINCVVIHQIDYTCEQYSTFHHNHQCKRKKKQIRELEGECDFVVIGDKFVAVFEVKGLSFQGNEQDCIKFKGCCESAQNQRQRMKDLIQSMDPLVMIYQFTAFPNISIKEVDERDLKDETILFADDLENLDTIVECCETFSSRPISMTDAKTGRDKLCCSLLGLWCINQENRWRLSDCSLPECIKDIDEKLRRALVTRESVDKARNSGMKKKRKQKSKKYPENPEMKEAPDLFKDYLNISSLTQDQLDIFNSNERFLWVESPAGTGKTVVMLGKIIHLALTTPPESRILLILSGVFGPHPVNQRHLALLNNIRHDITCRMISYTEYAVKIILN